MTDLRTAAEAALEALEDCADLLKQFEAPVDSCVGASMTRAKAAADAVRAALEVLEIP